MTSISRQIGEPLSTDDAIAIGNSRHLEQMAPSLPGRWFGNGAPPQDNRQGGFTLQTSAAERALAVGGIEIPRGAKVTRIGPLSVLIKTADESYTVHAKVGRIEPLILDPLW